LAFFPIIIVILVLAPKTTDEKVFLTFTDNGSGWPTVAWATLVGQVSSMFSVLGSDSVAHMAEEVEEAGRIVPRSMIWSFVLNIPFTFCMVISYLYCIMSLDDALSDPTGYPFIYVFRQATGSNSGTTGMTVVILLLLIMITISSMASTSRQTFAFARDHGLPFSTWLGNVNTTWHVPLNSIIFTMLFSCIVSLINIGSTAAFNALLSLSTVALMATYLVSISCVLLRRVRGQYLPPARWSLGAYGLPINAAALVYSIWSFFWSFWPNSYHVEAENFNWACVLFVGLMGLGSLLYFTHARKIYDGPVAIVKDGGRLH
jgi:choline transport protein